LWWWQDLVRPYVKNEAVYTCPSASPHMVWSGGRPAGAPNPLIRDYIGNAAASAPDRGIWPPGGSKDWRRMGPFTNNQGTDTDTRRMAEIEDPSGTIAVFDGQRARSRSGR